MLTFRQPKSRDTSKTMPKQYSYKDVIKCCHKKKETRRRVSYAQHHEHLDLAKYPWSSANAPYADAQINAGPIQIMTGGATFTAPSPPAGTSSTLSPGSVATIEIPIKSMKTPDQPCIIIFSPSNTRPRTAPMHTDPPITFNDSRANKWASRKGSWHVAKAREMNVRTDRDEMCSRNSHTTDAKA